MATKARQQYFADESSLQKQSREFSIADEIQQKIDGIEEGAQVNVIETVKVNGVALVPDVNKAVDITVPGVIDSLSSTSIDDALSARQGKVLYDYIQSIGARGRFLSNWNCATGLPVTDPEESPYLYKAGDYYSVSNVATSPATNYRPDGTQYVARQASTTVETGTVGISDFYLYDGTTWLHLANSGRTIAIDSSLSTTSTNPVENRVITNALNSKADTTYVDAHDTVVSSTAPSNPTQGMVWYDTTNDVLKTYDGTSWTGVGVECNTKTFYLSSTSDLTTAQAALDWYNDGKNPLIIYNNQCYIVRGVSPGHLYFGGQNAGGVQIDNIGYYNLVAQDVIELRSLSGVVQSIYVSLGNITGRFLDPTQNYTNPYIPLYPGSPATKKYVDDRDTYIGSSEPTSNKVEGRLWYDTTNDQLKVYDGTNWDAVENEYNAGEGIKIGTAQDYSAMRGPCPEGFHIPTYNEVLTLNSMCSTLGTTFSTHLFFPYNIHNIKNNGTHEDAVRSMYWTCEKSALDYYATVLHINSVAQQPSTSMMFCSCGIAIRPFKDVTKIPDSNWTTIFDGSNIANNAGVFYNSNLGILSISSDGINRITIADKNVGATQVYHDGDTLSDANRGLYYQFGNNYGFSWDGGYTTSSTKVDTTGYGPGNYYYDDVFITTGNNEWWSSVDNPDIWGGATGVVTLDNVITNTGVLSVNGQTGDVIVDGSNTKTFYLSSTSDLTNAQAAYDWYSDGKIPVLEYGDKYYVISSVEVGSYEGQWYVYFSSAERDVLSSISFIIDVDSVTNIGTWTQMLSDVYLAKNNTAQFTPTGNYNPATKKYVDDRTPIVSATVPSSPTEGMLWYDTTNDILKTYDGTNWNVTSNFPGMTVLSYGHNTWQDFLDAYNRDAIVYCRASSQSNPGTGNQTRMAFMAFVDKDATTGVIQGVEFQYYRSRSDHNSAANQLDEVYVYKLVPADGGTWTVTQRNTGAKAVAGTGISLAFGSGNMTISNTGVISVNGDTGAITLPNQVCVYNMPTVGGNMTDIISALTSGNSVLLNNSGTYYLVSYFDDSVGEIEAYSADGIGTVTFASITYSSNQCSSLSYSTKEIIPSQSGNSGKFLTTNGTVASWGTAIGNDTTGTTTTVSHIWAGTQAEYNALQTYNPNTIYHIY